MPAPETSSAQYSGPDQIDFGALKDHPAFQVHLTWRAIRLSFRGIRRKIDEGVRRGSYSIPILIWQNPGISPRELADSLHLDASKVAPLLRQLDEQGLLERVSSVDDGRRIGLHLTSAGQDYAANALKLSLKYEEPVRAALDNNELAALIRLLAKIQHSLDPPRRT